MINKSMCNALITCEDNVVLGPRDIDNTTFDQNNPLICDTFSVNRGYGAVDGTPCDTVGVRKVQDVAPLSINVLSGLMHIYNQGAVWGNKYLVFKTEDVEGIPRVAGTVLEMVFYLYTYTNRAVWIGFNTDDTPTQIGIAEAEHAILFNTDAKIDVGDGAVITQDIATYQQNVYYSTRIVLKDVGATYYISGGAFGQVWATYTLLRDSDIGSSAILYPCISSFNHYFYCTSLFVRTP